MKETAYVVFDWKGVLQTKVSARAISSREAARRLGPLADEDKLRQVLWRRPSFSQQGKLVRRSHFSYFPSSTRTAPLADLRSALAAELDDLEKARGQSLQHRTAVDSLVRVLNDHIKRGIRLNWSFQDPRLGFPFKGNLLADAVDVRPNVRITMSTGHVFTVDVAIIGRQIARAPVILGAIEVEFSHEFDTIKSLMLQSLGFPLFSVDVSESRAEDLDDAWAARVLAETTWTSPDGRRKNFIYISDAIAPLFVEAPRLTAKWKEHQFFVFAADRDLQRLNTWLEVMCEKLQLHPRQCRFGKVAGGKGKPLRTMLESAGEIAGAGWQSLNAEMMLSVTLERPRKKAGALYQAHLLFARLISCDIDAIVGYRCSGVTAGAADRVWLINDQRPGELAMPVPFLPQRVAYPTSLILDELAKLKR